MGYALFQRQARGLSLTEEGREWSLRAQQVFGLIGEAVFIPRGAGETDGWLATYVYHPEDATSDLVLLDAAAPDAAPVAVIRMPQRVPAGLHGIWVPG